MDIKSIIREQREELERIYKSEHIIPRERLYEAEKYLSSPNILVVTGIRRCGKSIFCYLLEKNENFGYLNFDDERLLGLKSSDLNNVLESFYELYGDLEYIALDEIQNVPGWELFVTRIRRTKKIILTGSNSNLLSGELATHLTGRYIDIKLFPFSFGEFLLFKGFKDKGGSRTTFEKAELMKFLTEYLEIGGLPETYKFGKIMAQKIYEDILTKDILLRYKIKKIEKHKI
jgi:predicted AAA+ superfamily ATPase